MPWVFERAHVEVFTPVYACMCHPSQSCSMHAALGNWRRGCLCSSAPMTGNAAQNSNSSQFYITLAAAPQCDGKHVVIGEVVDGLGIVARIGAACCCLPVLFFGSFTMRVSASWPRPTKCDTSEAVSVAKCQQALGCDLPAFCRAGMHMSVIAPPVGMLLGPPMCTCRLDPVGHCVQRRRLPQWTGHRGLKCG